LNLNARKKDAYVRSSGELARKRFTGKGERNRRHLENNINLVWPLRYSSKKEDK
jgi:hypothetical protein